MKFADYKKHWDRRDALEKAAGEKLRKEALHVSEQLKNILVKEFKAKRVILFGSVLQKDCFDRCSDIDLAVEGLPKKTYFTALARLMMVSPFEVDLKPVEDMKKTMKDSLGKGEILYEKRKAS